MPHLTLQISSGGPILDFLLMVSEPRIQALQSSGQTVPQPIKARELVDTGASCTCVDPSLLQSLSLTPTGYVDIHTPSTGNETISCEQYDVQLILPHTQGSSLRFSTLPVIASNLDIQGIQALIGRDVLSKCLVVYDGTANIFTFAF